MRSVQSRIINLFLRALRVKKIFDGLEAAKDDRQAFLDATLKARNSNMAQVEPPPEFELAHPYDKIDIDGFALHIHQTGSRQKVMLFLHGGAYVFGLTKMYWEFASKVAKQADYHLAMFDYPLAPENVAKTTVAQSVAAYKRLLEQYDPADIVIMGDSAGGGLALALTMKLRELELSQPSRLMLLYPWVDITCSHPKQPEYLSKERLLTREGLIACGKMYAGDLDPTDPIVSPWFGSLEGLPPMHIFTGTYDILHPEAHDLYKKGKEAGADIHFYKYEKMVHVWVLFAMPETTTAINQICEIMG